MVFWEIVCGYLALAAIFYMGMTLNAAEAAVPVQSRQPKWHRARHVSRGMVLRRWR